ncbi:MAG: family 78 glycoside hydrolase catalytic domain, partial [Acidobacteriota bacterium]
ATTPEKLQPGAADMWDSGRVPSDDSTLIPYDGKPLSSGQRYYWQIEAWNRDGSASARADSFWEMGLLHRKDWQAQWIGLMTEKSRRPDSPGPSPYLRKELSIRGAVRRARLYATALGCYELHLNGERVGNDVLTPGWTDYRRRIQYQTYDVTSFLQEGENVLGAVLGDGWYAGSIGWEGKRYHYGPYPLAFLAQLQIDYSDGRRELVATDGSWKGSTGPILASDFLIGETYDARLAIPGWSESDFDNSTWQAVSVLPPPGAVLVAQRSPTVQRTQELVPVGRLEPAPGVHVYDLGQNMVGWARLRVRAETGTRLELRFAEMLQPDGNVYTENLRRARSTDVYIAKGGELEVFEPHFTFHGFRYVEVRGYPGEPPLGAVTGIVVHSATTPTGSFETSSTMLNQLQSNIVWSQRGNFLSIPTDCPQRDERLGWMGDAQIFAPTACFNMDVAAFFTKWMQDVVDAQSAEGGFSDVSPRLIVTTDGAPGWGDAGVIVPWTHYQCYGDKRILERHYRPMQKWIGYIHRANPDLIRKNRLNNNYGDWVAIGAETPKELLATAFFAHSTRLLAKIARVLGYETDAAYYESLFEQIKLAFNREFVDEENRLRGDTQTAYVLALRFGLLSEERRVAATGRLVEKIEEKTGHLSTGFLGVRHLLPALTENGRLDMAYRLLMNDTFPSWGYEIRNGATTIWERWDGWTEEKGFQDPGMNSFNHYAFGSVGEWLYEHVAGIGLDESRPGYKRILFRPRPGGGLTHARATHRSLYGTIESAWRKDGSRFELTVEIPVNTEALVYVPVSEGGSVEESGLALEQADGVTLLRREDGYVVLAVGSGKYTFQSTIGAPSPGNE